MMEVEQTNVICDEDVKPVKSFCLICCNTIRDVPSSELKPPNELDDIFFVLSNYMKWNETDQGFEFESEVFPFCDKCSPQIENVFELDKRVHSLLSEIDQICVNLTSEIVESQKRGGGILKNGLQDGNQNNSAGGPTSLDSKSFDAEKVCAFRDVIVKRFTSSIKLTPLRDSLNEQRVAHQESNNESGHLQGEGNSEEDENIDDGNAGYLTEDENIEDDNASCLSEDDNFKDESAGYLTEDENIEDDTVGCLSDDDNFEDVDIKSDPDAEETPSIQETAPVASKEEPSINWLAVGNEGEIDEHRDLGDVENEFKADVDAGHEKSNVNFQKDSRSGGVAFKNRSPISVVTRKLEPRSADMILGLETSNVNFQRDSNSGGVAFDNRLPISVLTRKLDPGSSVMDLGHQKSYMNFQQGSKSDRDVFENQMPTSVSARKQEPGSITFQPRILRKRFKRNQTSNNLPGHLVPIRIKMDQRVQIPIEMANTDATKPEADKGVPNDVEETTNANVIKCDSQKYRLLLPKPEAAPKLVILVPAVPLYTGFPVGYQNEAASSTEPSQQGTSLTQEIRKEEMPNLPVQSSVRKKANTKTKTTTKRIPNLPLKRESLRNWSHRDRLRQIDSMHFIFDEKHAFSKNGDSNYTCETCGRRFGLNRLKLHLLSSCVLDDAKKIEELPNDKFKYEGSVFLKLNEHLFKCLVCGHLAESKERVIGHIQTAHICRFNQSRLHVEKLSDDKIKYGKFVVESSDGQFKCKECSHTANSLDEVLSHIRSSHIFKKRHPIRPIVEKLVETNPNEFIYAGQYRVLRTDEGKFTCVLCSSLHKNESNMITHLRYFHIDPHRFNCEECGKGFPVSSLLLEHKLEHRNDPSFKCDSCEKSFVTSHQLLSHKYKYHSENQLLSQKYKYHSENQLLSHKYKYHSEKKILCQFCGKNFLMNSHLQMHLKVHTGIIYNPVVCEICGKELQSSQLKRHMTIHGDPQFHCSVCNKSFYSARNLKNHGKSHDGKTTCEICGKAVITRILKQHQNRCREASKPRRVYRKRGEGTLSCDICGYKFYKQKEVNHHKQRFHSDLTPKERALQSPSYRKAQEALSSENQQLNRRSKRGTNL